MNATAEIEVAEPLNAEQRCDRCGAQAVVVVFLPTPEGFAALDLMFCGHHWREHRAAVLDNPTAVAHLHPAPTA